MPLERGPLNTFVSKNTKFESDFSKTNEDMKLKIVPTIQCL